MNTKKILSLALVALISIVSLTDVSEAARRKTSTSTQQYNSQRNKTQRYNNERAHRRCDDYARDMASRRAGGRQVLGGAALGAATGAAIGAIAGGHHSVGKGAAIGGVGGVVAGGVYANNKWRDEYDRAYDRCRYRR